MKRKLLFAIISILFVGLQSCEKSDNFEEDVFRVTFLRKGDGCPAGPLVQFEKKDIHRLTRFLPDGYSGNGLISAVNLEDTYSPEQIIVIKIRRRTDDEIHFCTADIAWYAGIHVLEAHAE
ncbi:hypothetical protein [Parapedobacter tibetensis]|uniref:hypothetical protein n=1 Tax=Parapedobacter tibetensis TaxID=2972951 RepID=UPI00214D87D8|nr:hypothetical protein [Parapedobacter tibetensis]